MLFLVSHAIAATPINTSAIKSVTTCLTTSGGGCPKATANPIVAQPNGEILPPDPFLTGFIASLFEGEVGGIPLSVSLGGEEVSGTLLFALDDSGNPDPATWLGFGSVSHDWNGDGTADASVGQVNWESRGQVSTTIAFMSGTDGEFVPTHDVSLAVTLTQGGSGIAPMNAWVVESMGVFDHSTGESVYQTDAATATSVSLEILGLLYTNTFRTTSTSTTATELLVWTVEEEALVVSGKGQLTPRGSLADQTMFTTSDGATFSESWSADANASNFRRTVSSTAGGSVIQTASDLGGTRRVLSETLSVDGGEFRSGRAVAAPEDLTVTSFTYGAMPASNWERLSAALGGEESSD